MTSNSDDFERELEREQKMLFENKILAATQKLALEGLRRLVNKTPVDTGRAKGNWQTTIGSVATGTNDTTDPGGQKTISQGADTITGAPIFRPIAITNNLPYIVALEHGHSQQAPHGMLAITVSELESQFREVRNADLQ